MFYLILISLGDNMAIIECPNCKKKVSDLEEGCPYCGYRFKAEDVFKSGNTIDFAYKDEPIYKAAKIHFYATFTMMLAIMADIAGILLLIISHFISGSIVLTGGIIITILSGIALYIGKKKRIEAEKED